MSIFSAYSNESSVTTLDSIPPLIKDCLITAIGTGAIGVENISGTSTVAYSQIAGDTDDLKQDAGTLNVLRCGYDTTNTSGTITRLDGDVPTTSLSSALTSSNILVGNVSNIATDVALSGDATLANTGALTLNTVNTVTPGSFGSATTTPVITVNGKGLITASSAATITGVSPVGAALTRGSLLRGSAAGAVEALAKGAAGTFPVWDATDLVVSKLTLTQPATAATLTIADNAVVSIPETGTVALATGLVSANQIIYGSQDANGDLTLEGTSHATKTTSYVILQPTSGNVGIGTIAPATLLHTSTSLTTAGIINQITIGRTGAAANNDGSAIRFASTDSTTADMSLARLRSYFVDKTHATMTSAAVLSVYYGATPTERDVIRIVADSVSAKVGILTAPTALLHLAAGAAAANNAPFKFTAGPLLTTVEEGAMEFKGHTLYMTTFQVRRSVALAQEVPIADVTATAATETTVYSISMAANYLTAGKHIEINLQGIFSSIAGPNGVATIRLKYAGATIHTFTTAAGLNTNSPFDTTFNTTCRAIGSGTTGKLLSWSEFAEGATSATESITRASGALTDIDTETSNTITITVQFATADAGNSFTVRHGHTLCIDANT